MDTKHLAAIVAIWACFSGNMALLLADEIDEHLVLRAIIGEASNFLNRNKKI